ncbi:MAG: sulfatase [Caldilineaceae bacterium]|nr:sulfatase [Caldilineaceae bacterium]
MTNQPNQPPRPHILYMDCHDLGNWLGCYGRAHLNTPNLDRLAAAGAQLTAMIATAPICMPSRASLYTGQMPHTVGVNGQFPLQSGTRCLAHYFADAGYDTVLVGNPKLRATPTELGFRTHVPVPSNATFEATAADWIRRHASGASTPFLLSISFDAVHRPFGNIYDPAVAEQLPVPPYLPDNALVRRDLATLHCAINALDNKVGQILAALATAGCADDTLVVFTTEHGPAIARAKHTLYDAGLRTALLLRYPRWIAAGRSYGELLSNVDLLPTLLDLAGVDVPNGLQGRSFANLLTDSEHGEGHAERTAVFAEHSWGRRAGLYHYTPSRAIRTARYKYIANFTDTPPYIDTDWLARFGPQRQLPAARYGNPAPAAELYDLKADPNELNNVAAQPTYATIRNELNQQLMAFLEATKDPILMGPIPHPEGLPNVPLWEKQVDGSFQLRAYHAAESNEAPIEEIDP